METPSRYARETAATTSNILMPSATEVNLELRLAANFCLEQSVKCKALQLLRKPGDAVVGVIRRGIRRVGECVAPFQCEQLREEPLQR